MYSFLTLFFFMLLCLFLIDCGGTQDKEPDSLSSDRSNFISVPFYFNKKNNGNNLNLSSELTSLYVDIINCNSGYEESNISVDLTTVNNVISGSVELVQGDKNCVVFPSQYILGNHIFKVSSSQRSLASTWFASSASISVGEDDGLARSNVIVSTQLNNQTISNSSSASFIIKTLDGADMATDSHGLAQKIPSTGNNIPDWSLISQSFESEAAGISTFDFEFSCPTVTTGSVAGSNITCGGNSIANMAAILISPKAQRSKSSFDALSSFLSINHSVTYDCSGSTNNDCSRGCNAQSVPGSDQCTSQNGGFSVRLKTPVGPLANYPYFLLVLKNNNTYLYFEIKLENN